MKLHVQAEKNMRLSLIMKENFSFRFSSMGFGKNQKRPIGSHHRVTAVIL